MTGKVLIVDDEPEICEIVSDILTMNDYQLHIAHDGQEALEFMQSEKRNEIITILSDIRMPRLDGLSFVRKIREEKIIIPVIFLTAYADKANILEALKGGAIDFLEKPIISNQLLQTMQRATTLGQKIKTVEKQVDAFLKVANPKDEDAIASAHKLKELIMESLKLRNKV